MSRSGDPDGAPKAQRRAVLSGMLASAAAACVPIDQSALGRLSARLRILEAATAGGALGAAIIDTETGQSISHNGSARFGHCSSFKTSLAALVLARHASGAIDADRNVRWSEEELLSYAPFTTPRLQQGASLRELAEATQRTSDNTAANVLLRELGGPEALNQFWRSIGDETSRLDRIEPALNHVPLGEVRDTSTPLAMARTLAKLTYGDVLPSEEREQLRRWMVDTQTGLNRVRAGLPEGWAAGDKTGTSFWPGMGSLYVDIGFAEPPGRAPIAFAAYFRAQDTHQRVEPAAEALLAEIGKVLVDFARG